jgi:hypothetical protein
LVLTAFMQFIPGVALAAEMEGSRALIASQAATAAAADPWRVILARRF